LRIGSFASPLAPNFPDIGSWSWEKKEAGGKEAWDEGRGRGGERGQRPVQFPWAAACMLAAGWRTLFQNDLVLKNIVVLSIIKGS